MRRSPGAMAATRSSSRSSDSLVDRIVELSFSARSPVRAGAGIRGGRARRRPVDLDITIDVRLAEPIEVAAYFVVSEALANAAKHSQASRIDVSVRERDGSLVLSVRDDGVGGADAARGSGLVGLMDRVEAHGGSIRVSSLPGTGTQITAELPLELELPQPVASLAPDSP